MNKLYIALFSIGFLWTQSSYYGSTLAPVVVAGGIIKARYIDETPIKYKRKDCPVCKGKGWYMSGDGIKRVNCAYCEPDTTQNSINNINTDTKQHAK